MKAWVPLTHLQLTADLISSKPSLTLSDINLTQFKYHFMHTYFSLYCQKKRNIKKQNCNIIILKINDNSLVSSASFFLDFIFNSFDCFFFFFFRCHDTLLFLVKQKNLILLVNWGAGARSGQTPLRSLKTSV